MLFNLQSSTNIVYVARILFVIVKEVVNKWEDKFKIDNIDYILDTLMTWRRLL